MHVKVLRSLWGLSEGASLEQRLCAIRDEGYDGVEAPLGFTTPEAWKAVRPDLSLDLVVLIAAETAEGFSAQLEAARAYEPALVVSHSGLDRMTFEDGCEFLIDALRAQTRAGVPVAHSTCRGRLFYAPWVTWPYLEEFPDLRLSADLGHWCVVTESLLEEVAGLVNGACAHAIHINGRVGSEQTPQVADPRDPRYRRCVERFEYWWDTIRKGCQARGETVLGFTPAYGPAPYMPALPYTAMPVADLHDICLWAAERIRRRWSLDMPAHAAGG